MRCSRTGWKNVLCFLNSGDYFEIVRDFFANRHDFFVLWAHVRMLKHNLTILKKCDFAILVKTSKNDFSP